MFANRYTAFIDACVLAGALKRNLLLSLADAEFFRARWSKQVLDETQRAIASILAERGLEDADARARRARVAIEDAFDEAIVESYDSLLPVGSALPDAGDAHVLAAALKTQAAVIVTDNLKHFPASILAPLNLEARGTDDFLADMIALDVGRAVVAFREMRLRFKKPEMTAEALLTRMDAAGLTETVNQLRPYVDSL